MFNMSNSQSFNSSRNVMMFVTCIRSEGKFLKFFALSEYGIADTKKLENLLHEKTYELEADEPMQRSHELPPGSLCYVKSAIKRSWCRARVQYPDFGIYRIGVMLIDYGDMEILPMISVRKCLDPVLQSQPPLVKECILADVGPPFGVEWPPEAIKLCEEHLLFQKVSGYIVSEFENFLVVRVAKMGETEPFVQRLINSSLAKIEPLECAAKPEPIYIGPSYKYMPLGAGTSHMVTICFVSNPQNFYIQLSPAEVELNNLMEAIEQWSNLGEMEFLTSPLINTPCLVQLNSNSLHYFRGIIKDASQENCKVFLVDYGSIVTQKFRQLRVLPKHFLALPAQAMRCALIDAHQVDTDMFKKVCTTHRYLTCHILTYSREAYHVRLLHHNEDILSLVKKLERNIPPPVIDFPIEPLQIGSSIEVNTSYICGPQEFYCQKTAYKNHLDAVTNILTNIERFSLLEHTALAPGFSVVAKFSEDGLWYRAKILKVEDIYNITVFFVDYGNTDNVKLQDLRIANQELFNIPSLAFRFALYDLPSSEGSLLEDACDALEQLTADKTLKADIKSNIADGSYFVVLFDLSCPQTSINETLEAILSPPRCVYPPVNKTEVICIMYYTSPSLFFGQLTKYDSVVLTNLQTDMNAFYGNLNTRSNTKPKVGDLVSAKFSEDDTFYRAKVVSLDNNSCKVFFVDYGNTDTVSMEDIHELHSKFCTHPIFGIECILENCPASAPIDELEELMMDKEIQVALVKEISLGKWLVSLTENYAGNVDILACFDKCSMSNKPIIPQTGFAMNRINSGPPNKAFESASSETRSHSPRSFPPEDMKHKSPSPPAKETPIVSQLTDYDLAVIPNGCYKEVYVCLVKNPNEFYCQLISDDTVLQSMMSKITSTYNNLQGDDLKLDNVRVGMACCAIYEEDSMWYRAKITDYRSGSNSCKVLFVDYGNTETVPLSKMRALHHDFFNVTQQALKCGLFNIAADGETWDAGAIEAFSEMASDKSFLAQFVKLDSKETHLVNLLPISKLTDDVLNEEFIKLGHGHMSESNKSLVVNSFTASTSLEFKEPEIDFNKPMDVTIVWVTKFMNFYCQLKSYSTEFHKMMVDIQSHYGKEAAACGVIDRPHAGMICIAQFSKDSAWYRAKIVEVEKQDVKVHYVDYGNSENISKKCVKYILQDFTLLPTQAIKCCLHGIQLSKNRIQESITHLLEGDSTCTFVSKEKDSLFVILECNRKNIAQELVRMNLAVGNEPTDLLKHSPVVSAVSKSSIPKTQAVFEKGQLISVVASYVTNPQEFWCQLDDGVTQLDVLMEAIESHYAESTANDESSYEIGSFCIAKYSGDEGWYRAVVKSCPNVNKVEVMFVDYGNSEVVDYSEVRTIVPEFLQLPAQALKCQLYGLPPSCDDNSKLKFKEITEMSTELMAKIESVQNDILTVSLFDSSNPDNEVNVLEAAFGISVQVETIEETSHIGFLQPNLPLGTDQGYVSSVQNPLDFYVQLSSQEAELEIFSENLQGIYAAETDVPPILENVTVGAACCAQFSEDEAWYRAIITNIQDNAVTVVFIDYGNFDTVPRTSLRTVYNDILGTPPFAIPCKLAMVSSGSEEWSPTAKETFRELTDDVLLEFNFLNKNIPALINIMREGKSVSNSLIEMGLAFELTDIENGQNDAISSAAVGMNQSEVDMNQITANTNLSATEMNQRALPSKMFKAKMAFVDSYKKFYITAVDWSDERDTLMNKVEETYSDDDDNALSAESVQLNGLCVAKYSEDEAWYRAIITEIDNSNALVKFIDYGNSETTLIDSLKQLTSNLLTYPPCAVECHLSELHPVLGQESEITALLQSFADEETEFEAIVINFKEPYSIRIETVDGDFVNLQISKGAAAHQQVKEVNDSIDVQVSANDNEDIISTDVKLAYPERVITSSKLQAKICFVDSWDKFYVMPTDQSDELDSLMAKIEKQYGDEKDTSEFILQNVQEHQPCIAKYSEDGAWYRAVVTSVHNDDNIFVNFVDYGNLEITNLQNLRTITPDLLIEPSFAIKCELFEVLLAEGAASKVTARLQTLCDEEAIFEMEIFDHLLPCKIRIRGDVDFVEQLLQDELALKDLSSDRIQNPETFKENLQIAFVEDTKRSRIPTRLLPSGRITAYVKHCHISANGCVSLYVVEEHLEDALAEQQENLQIAYSDTSKTDLTITEGDNCIAMFPEDSCWYRAVVLERHSDKVIVKFVDFGNSEVITIDSIKELVPEFAEQANFCTECVLSCVKAVEGSEEAVEQRFLDIEEKYQLDLCDFNLKNDVVCVKGIALNDTDIIPQMVEETLVRQVLPSHYSFDSFECKISKQQIEDNLFLHLSPLCLEEKYHELKESLTSVYDGFVLSESPKICLNDLYVVKKDSEYFRAYINNFEDSVAHVIYVDTGNTCSVPLSDIRLLYQDFCHIPPFSLQCCLQGVNSGEDQEFTSQKFFDFLEGKIITCTFTGFIRSRNYHEVQMTVDGENVLAKLLGVDAANNSMVDKEEPKFVTDVSTVSLAVSSSDIVPNNDDGYIQEENIVRTLDESFNTVNVNVVEGIDKTDMEENKCSNEISQQLATNTEGNDVFFDENAEIDNQSEGAVTIQSIEISNLEKCEDEIFGESAADKSVVALNNDLEKCDDEIFDESTVDESVVTPNDDLEKCEDEILDESAVDKSVVAPNDDLEKCEDELFDKSAVDKSVIALNDVLEKCEDEIFDESGVDKSVVAPNDDLEKCEDEILDESAVDKSVVAPNDDLEKCEDELFDKSAVDKSVIALNDVLEKCEDEIFDESGVDKSVVAPNDDLEKCEDKILDESAVDKSVVVPNDDLEKCEDKILDESAVDESVIDSNDNLEKYEDEIFDEFPVDESVVAPNDDLEKCEDETTNHQVVDMVIDEALEMLAFEVPGDAATSFSEKPECETNAVANTEDAAEDEVKEGEAELPSQYDNIDLCEADLPECEQSCTESYQLEESEIGKLGDSVQPTDEKTVAQSVNLDDCSVTVEASAVVDDDKMHSPIKSDFQTNQKQSPCGDIDDNLMTTVVKPDSAEDFHFSENIALNANLNEEVDYQSENDFVNTSTMDGAENVLAYTEDRMIPLGKIEVMVTEVKVQDDSVFLAVRPMNLQNDFQQLQTDLNDFYSDAQDEPICSLVLGPCAIQSSGEWYRGNILAIEGECVTVLYSDLGHGETIDALHVRKLQESFMLHPPYIVWCILLGFRCIEAEAVSNHLNVNFKNMVLSIEVLDEEHPCRIKLPGDNIIISELLSKGLLVPESVGLEECDVHTNLVENSVLSCTPENISELTNSSLSNQNSFVNKSLANENCLDQNQNAHEFSLGDDINQNISAQEENGLQ